MDKSGPRRAAPPRPSQSSAPVLDSWCPPVKSRTVEKKYNACLRLMRLPEKSDCVQVLSGCLNPFASVQARTTPEVEQHTFLFSDHAEHSRRPLTHQRARSPDSL